MDIDIALNLTINHPFTPLLFQNDYTGLYSHLTGVPKALLPGIGGKKILDFWWEAVNMYVRVWQVAQHNHNYL